MKSIFKILFIGTLIHILTTSLVHADSYFHVQNGVPLTLNQNSNEMALLLSYPGANLSGYCGIELRGYKGMQALLNQLELSSWGAPVSPSEIIGDQIVSIDLVSPSQNLFAVDLEIKTKNGSPLQGVISAVMGFGGPTIYIVPKPCYSAHTTCSTSLKSN